MRTSVAAAAAVAWELVGGAAGAGKGAAVDLLHLMHTTTDQPHLVYKCSNGYMYFGLQILTIINDDRSKPWIPSRSPFKTEQNGDNFSFISFEGKRKGPQSVYPISGENKGNSLCISSNSLRTNNSSLEGAMELNFAPFCYP